MEWLYSIKNIVKPELLHRMKTMNYEVEINNSISENQIFATVKYPCGEVLESWIVDSFIEGAALVERCIQENPLIRHKGCRDEYCDDTLIRKYALYALGHYLSYWPEDWNYPKIIHVLKNGNERQEISASQAYEDVAPEELAILIGCMIEDLSRYFPETN